MFRATHQKFSSDMIFGVDIDGVIRDMVSSAISVYNKEFGENLKPEDWKLYNPDLQFPKIKEIKGYSADKWFFEENGTALFRDSKPIGNPSDSINRLRKFGKVVIISYQKSYQNKMDTLQWLCDNGIESDGICFVDDKSIVRVNYLIDDNPEYLFRSNCEHAILISAPYNIEYEFDSVGFRKTEDRFDSFDEFVKYIENKHFVKYIENKHEKE